MPTISMFYGLLIRMFFRDTEKHHAPHVHADYQGQVAVYAIPDGQLWPGRYRLTSTSSLSRGSRFTARISSPTGSWR